MKNKIAAIFMAFVMTVPSCTYAGETEETNLPEMSITDTEDLSSDIVSDEICEDSPVADSNTADESDEDIVSDIISESEQVASADSNSENQPEDGIIFEEETEADQENASDSDIVYYDANTFAPYVGRTADEVVKKYYEAMNVPGYDADDENTWYDIKPSTKAPYSLGKESKAGLEAITKMANYYRYLVGFPAMKTMPQNPNLHATAYDRTFECEHAIWMSSKPDDMPLELWMKGHYGEERILAGVQSPRSAVYVWVNEGKLNHSGLSDADDYGLEHRNCVLTADQVSFGYATRDEASGFTCVAGKDVGEYNFTHPNQFWAFPCPGYIPNSVAGVEGSWGVNPNQSQVIYNVKTVSIKVTDLDTGTAYICTEANGWIRKSSCGMEFMSPEGNDLRTWTHNYRIEVSGLTDVATGKKAVLAYNVYFVDLATGIAAKNKKIRERTVAKVFYQYNSMKKGYPATLKNGKILVGYTDKRGINTNLKRILNDLNSAGIGQIYADVRTEGTTHKIVKIKWTYDKRTKSFVGTPDWSALPSDWIISGEIKKNAISFPYSAKKFRLNQGSVSIGADEIYKKLRIYLPKGDAVTGFDGSTNDHCFGSLSGKTIVIYGDTPGKDTLVLNMKSGYSVMVPVLVKRPFKISTDYITLKPKQVYKKLKITSIPEGDPVKYWKSSDPKIVKTKKSGSRGVILTAGKKTGKATVTVVLKSGKKQTITVWVL